MADVKPATDEQRRRILARTDEFRALEDWRGYHADEVAQELCEFVALLNARLTAAEIERDGGSETIAATHHILDGAGVAAEVPGVGGAGLASRAAWLAAERDDLSARVRELSAALQPFAVLGQETNPVWSDQSRIIPQPNGHPNLGDCRHAARLLGQPPPAPPR